MIHLFQHLSRRVITGLLAVASCLLLSCGPESTTIVSKIQHYDINKPAKIVKLPPLLDEISGITYYPKDSSLFAIQDEEGFIYKIFPWHPDSMLRYKFAGRGDFEDVALVNQTFYVLRSDGTIFTTTIGSDVTSVKSDYGVKGNEFEGLYFDDSLQQLRLLCKDCEVDGKKHVSTYLFNPQSGQYSSDSMRIDALELAQILGEKKIKFKPSAVAVNPIDHRIYMISSVNKVLVIANRDGTIYATSELDHKIYKQPEGMAFAPDGTMFISNESADVGAATVLIIPYHTTR